ncbi:hypothetical protein AB0P21_40295 [Kribbella sp. NPDC056861]
MPTTLVEAPIELLTTSDYERPSVTSDEQGERNWYPPYNGPSGRPE